MIRAWPRPRTAAPETDVGKAAPATLTPRASAVLALQRSAGNAAVASLAAAPTTLTPSQVAHAIRANLAFDYDPAVLQQVREALGLPARGAIDEQFVQAVARWQGGRTLYP